MIYGEVLCPTAIADPFGENAIPSAEPVGRVAGLENFVPKPDDDQGYATTRGVELTATAIALLSGEKATAKASLPARLAGLEIFDPKPDEDQG